MKLSKSIRLSKLSIRHISEQTDYATSEALVESLHLLRATYNVPIDHYMRDLIDKKVDSISFTKDSPYYYFFARRLGSSIAVTYKETTRVIEFSLPMQEAEKVLAA
jgi:hypothetical protein